MHNSNIFKTIMFIVAFSFSLSMGSNIYSYAEDSELNPEIALSNNKDSSALTDNSHSTTVRFNKGDTITIMDKDDRPISGIYICWDTDPVEWNLTIDEAELICGTNGFLHEYVEFPTPSHYLKITIPKDGTKIDTIRIFKEGELPHDVQVWNPPCEKADIMVISSHADDEILFFGGALPLYAYEYDADVQVVYMCEFRSTDQDVREHEKLDGLWECGIKNYPTCGYFYDKYSTTIEKAKKQYDYDKMLEFLVSEIRRAEPQVVVTHDVNGEYGHGFHILTSKAVVQAVEDAALNSKWEDSYNLYGAWNTPKTYLHISKENTINLDLRVQIKEDYKRRTALEILKAAYKKHKSQQGYWFYVDDEYEYSCARFGLVRSLVGVDTTDDFLCNLTTYKVQEQMRIEQLELEKKAAEEQNKIEEKIKEYEQEIEALKILIENKDQTIEEQQKHFEEIINSLEEENVSLEYSIKDLNTEKEQLKKQADALEGENNTLKIESSNQVEDTKIIGLVILGVILILVIFWIRAEIKLRKH